MRICRCGETPSCREYRKGNICEAADAEEREHSGCLGEYFAKSVAYAGRERRRDLSAGPTALMVVVVMGARRAREAQRRLDTVIVDAGGRIGRRG